MADLLPERYDSDDLFLIDVLDAVPKSDIASMEFPLFTLSLKPEMGVRKFEQGKNTVTVAPSHIGAATVFDRDVLIYLISHVVAAKNRAEPIQRAIRFHASDLLRMTNRAKSARGYDLLHNALVRLQGTLIETDIKTGGVQQVSGFSFIDSYEIIRKTKNGRMVALEIVMSDWLFNALDNVPEVLTLHRDYFRLRKPLERRLYELARKHCGKGKEWTFKLKTLLERAGSRSTLSHFRIMVERIVAADVIPEYSFSIKDDKVTIKRRDATPAPVYQHMVISGDVMNEVRQIAQGWDVYVLEDEFREMAANRREPIRNVRAAFLGFVKNWVAIKGPA